MIIALLSSRIRTWLLLTVLLPVFGRVLEAAGVRVGARNPRAGSALARAGGYARHPKEQLRRRR